jgi:hypothetical protein
MPPSAPIQVTTSARCGGRLNSRGSYALNLLWSLLGIRNQDTRMDGAVGVTIRVMSYHQSVWTYQGLMYSLTPYHFNTINHGQVRVRNLLTADLALWHYTYLSLTTNLAVWSSSLQPSSKINGRANQRNHRMIGDNALTTPLWADFSELLTPVISTKRKIMQVLELARLKTRFKMKQNRTYHQALLSASLVTGTSISAAVAGKVRNILIVIQLWYTPTPRCQWHPSWRISWVLCDHVLPPISKDWVARWKWLGEEQ